ncbi:hypothetical protein H310_00206 [Aphanomyces invadans]|uniref:Uncharacterized protein n=1 Tax=Aphanomyces invadans TaxID=157072 RepID=A0A024UT51_9STRA|nr:hypothetical protein H310_00206 [Aphanomyces invadans]ETW09696.1 hypothetical protein H310_00206 [Aphanomyces invadans]|eukprot:XP_008861107.1 hypothetical protein H310_00206 [Aphanomyces invadans]
MESGAKGGYAAHTASEAPSPVKVTRPRKKHDDDVDHRYTSRKRGRREKDLDGGHHSLTKYLDEPREHHRSSVGEKAESTSNGNVSAAGIGPSVPPGAVLFLTHPGRDEIASGKSLLDLMRRSSRLKSKRRDDPRMEEAYFAVHDTVLVPQGLVDKIDAKLKDDFLAKVVADHTNNWIQMSNFVNNREFMQNLVQVVQPRYPCPYPTLLDEVLISFLFQRPEYADTLLKPLIQRLSHSNEPVAADKHSLVLAMQRHIAQLKRNHGHGDMAALSTRHQIATLAIMKTLFEGNDNLLLLPWILTCLHACTDSLLHVIVAKVTNSIGCLALLQPDPHNLQWLRMWQQEHWDVPHADVQLEGLVRLERKQLHDAPADRSCGSFHRAVVREALNQFGNQPQNRFHLFGEAFDAFFDRATAMDSFPLLEDTVQKYPPPYPNDTSYTHPVVAMIGLFKQTVPVGSPWFVGHLWPFVLQRYCDVATLRTIFQEHVLPLVFGTADTGSRDPMLVGMEPLVTFLDAVHTVSISTAREVFQVWAQVWMDSSFDVPTPVLLTLLCVALGLQHGHWTTLAGAAVVDEFCKFTSAIGHAFFASLMAHTPAPNLSPISWLLRAVLLSKGGLSPNLVVPLCQQVLVHLPEKPSVQWNAMFQRVLAMALVVEEGSPAAADSATFYDSETSTVVPFPRLTPSIHQTTDPVIVSRLQVLTALVLDDCHPTAAQFIRRQLLSDSSFQALLDLASSTCRDVASHTLTLLLELVPPASEDIGVSPFSQEFVVEALARLVSSPQQDVCKGALSVLDRLAAQHPDLLPLQLLGHCVSSSVIDVSTIVHLTNVTKQSMSRMAVEARCWRDVVQFIDRQFLLCMVGQWQDASPQHVALLMLRHMCHADLRPEWSKLICHGIRTMETSTEPLCLIQLDIVLWIVSHDSDHRFRPDFELANAHQQVERLLILPRWQVPSVITMARQALKGLEAYMAVESAAQVAAVRG